MPLDKKSFSFLHYLQTAYALDESFVQNLTLHFPLWTHQYKKVYQTLFEQLKKEKKTSKSLNFSLLELSGTLRLQLSDQLTEHDLLKILAEALLLSRILKENEWHQLIKQAHLFSLASIVQTLTDSNKEAAVFDDLQKIIDEITEHVPDDIQKPVWQHLFHVQQGNPTYPIIPKEASTLLISFSNSLLKRKLGLSLNDRDTQILWLNTLENHWEDSLLNCIEPDLQAHAMTERVLSCKISLMDFGLTYASYLHPASSYQPSLYWHDPLNSLEQGIQTSLFASVEDDRILSGKFKDKCFSFIGLDLRQSFHPYRYARKAMQSVDQQVLHLYQDLKLQEASVSYTERMLYLSMQKQGEQGILLAIVERKTIEEPQSQFFRQFLEHTFQEIYVLDLAEQEEEGLAILYLIKKSVAKKEHRADVQYAKLFFQELHAENSLDFESLQWQRVQTEQQSYWIALPDSDFFKLYPLFGTDKALFKRQATGIESFVDEWLMEDDAKLLEKKVKYFLKQYNRASGKGKEEPGPDIKWPENLKRMAQEGLPLSFDKQKINKIQVKPFVYAFMYAEEKLLLHSDAVAPAMLYASDLKQVFPLHQIWHTRFADSFFAYPLNNTELQKKTDENISDTALKHFRTHYQKRTKEFDQNFIVFPPENITHILVKMESVSRDLPVIRKYPNQISRLLEEARHFTSDVELLTPPYEKIDEFKRKVLLLEKDAIERKIIYQKVKGYIEELKEQLATLTREHDEALKDYEAVNKENIFYYTFAILHHPNYRKKYSAFLAKEPPRVPILPIFRQWVQWGKDLFQAHHPQTESGNVSSIQVKEEIHDEMISKSFTYKLDRERSLILLKEQFLQITLSNIPEEAWNYQLEERHPFTHYLDYLCRKPNRNRKIRAQFTQTRLADKAQIIANLKHLCSLSFRLAAVENEMQKVQF